MRQKVTLVIILIILLGSAVLLKNLDSGYLYGQRGYFFHSTVWICGVSLVIIIVNLIWNRIIGAQTQGGPRLTADPLNRRRTFRIIYPSLSQPVLIIEEADNCFKRQLEFPVVDLSQGGSCFLDDGSLGQINRFSGQIRFSNGNRIRVAGRLIGKTGQQVRVQFSQAIKWSTLLEEQRRIMADFKQLRRQSP